jgi:hypothetical protein
MVAAAFCLAAGCDMITPGDDEGSLSFEPDRLYLQAVEGSVGPVDQLVTLHHDGTGTISWTASCDQPWGTVSPSSGSMGPGTTMAVRVTADPQGMTEGTYSANVTAASGDDCTVLAVQLTVSSAGGPTAPVITVQPSDVTVTVDEDATFSVTAAGSAPITYQWSQGDTEIPGATSASFTVYSVTVDLDGALYACVVSNAYGSDASDQATLTVIPAGTPAAVATQPSGLSVSEREDATFTVVAAGDEPISYQWRRDGEDIPCATKSSFTVFSASLAADGTQYACVVSNASGSETSDAATLTVNVAPPVFHEHPHSRAVTVGEQAEFSAMTAGSGTMQWQWRRDGVDIPGETTGVYALSPAGLGDDGAVFTQVVSNEAGSVTSYPATLTVTQIAILTPGIPGALVGPDYFFQLEGAGGLAPYTWTVTAGSLPGGLVLDSANGYIYGVPTAPGTGTVTIQMQDSDTPPATATRSFTVVVHEPAMEIGVAEPEYTLDYIWGSPGDPLTATLTATGGTPPYTWSLELGTLPDGLTLGTDTGVISGTPIRGGTTRVLVKVTDSGGRSNLATVGIGLNPLGSDMPRLVNVAEFVDAEGIPRQAIITWSASLMQSVTVDALFMSASYPTRLHAFSPPTTQQFVDALPSLGSGEEMWEVPALDGGVFLNRKTLTDSQGRTTVLNAGLFDIRLGTSGFEYWPLHDSDSDGVPDSCDTVQGDDPSDALEIHRDVVLRDILPGEDLTPPELQSINVITVGVPGARSPRLIYGLGDDSFVAGGEVYVAFPDSSPVQTVTVPLSFQCITQPDPDFLKGFPGNERWLLPYIPCDFEVHGARIWDCHGNVLEWGMGEVSVYYLETATVPTPAVDVDGDSIHDGWETTYFPTPGDCDPLVDSDGDGYSNWDEYLLGGNPADIASLPVTHDSDSDGVPDLFDPDEPTSYVSLYTPLPPEAHQNYDYDSDGIPDIWESCYAMDPSSPAGADGDIDGDSLSNLDEFLYGNDPYDDDSDDDGTLDAADDEMGSWIESELAWGGGSVYTSSGEAADTVLVGGSEWRYDGTCSVVASFRSAYPLSWIKVKVRLYPTNEIVLVDAAKVTDPVFYGMWWIEDPVEVWGTPPIGEYFDTMGYFACDTHGRITGY